MVHTPVALAIVKLLLQLPQATLHEQAWPVSSLCHPWAHLALSELSTEPSVSNQIAGTLLYHSTLSGSPADLLQLPQLLTKVVGVLRERMQSVRDAARSSLVEVRCTLAHAKLCLLSFSFVFHRRETPFKQRKHLFSSTA